MNFLHRKNQAGAGRGRRLLALTVATAVALSSCAIFCLATSEDETRITFLAAGDNLIHSCIYREASTGGGYDFSPIYGEIAPMVAAADIAFVNQETPLGDSDFSGYPRFCSPYQAGDALIAAGFDVINLANNHMLDRGAEGLIRTRDYLAARAECVIGGDADGFRVVERQGIRIAFLAYTYSTNCDDMIDVPRASEARIRHQMAAARQAADLVFVSMHWGVEYDVGNYVSVFHPTTAQEEMAALLTELHADLVIGTHPHVLEPAEWKTASDGHRTLIVYSLGNLVSNMRFDKTLLGGILTLDIRQKKDYTILYGAKITPVVCHYSQGYTGHKVYFLKDYTDELARVHGTQKQANELPFCRETLIAYYEANIAEEFRPGDYN